MTAFIATFHSQWGAVQFLKNAKQHQIPCRLAPVPRTLPSSCGTCAHYSHHDWDPGFVMKDLETIYRTTEGGYEAVHQGE